MQSNHKKRICIVARSLSEGGSDRVAAMQSIYLSQMGYEVFIVIVLNEIAYPYKGQLLNLGLMKQADNSILGRYKRFMAFRNFVKSNNIACIIDHRVRIKTWSEYFISRCIYGKKAIYVVHSSAIERFFPAKKWLAKRAYKNAKKIVAVSHQIELLVKQQYGFSHCITMPNAIDFSYLEAQKDEQVDDLPEKFILWYGRLDNEVKNFNLLLEAYNLSQLKALNIPLIIVGKGKDKALLLNLIEQFNLLHLVEVRPFTHNPFKFVNKALFTVVSSNYEGLPMSVIETLGCGTPVVSVKFKNFEDTPLIDGFNGLWVDNFNAEALGNAFNTMVNNKELYFSCKKNARESVQHLMVEEISKQWMSIIEDS